MCRYLHVLCSLLSLGVAAGADSSPDFARDIQPIFQKRCYVCHGPQAQMKGLRLDDRQAAMRVIAPGDSAHSRLIAMTTGAGGKFMPPTGPPLSTQEVATLRAWIDQGAKWPDSAAKPGLWSLQPIAHPAPPAVRNRAWPANAIDQFILARLEDRLLASQHYGEKWARHWLDLAHYADSDGYEKDLERPWAWRYRRWVIDALNRDLPFDEFTIEQIAGDELPNPTVEQRVATGFFRQTLTNREAGVDRNEARFEQLVDRTGTLSTVWLGMTVRCAQCHDHKYDPIKQKDFYQILAYFNRTVEADIDAPLPIGRAHV